jgi:hypothetical protein
MEERGGAGTGHLRLYAAHLFLSDKQLKGQCREIFASGFFRESPSPKPLKITVE